jgi:hypothetical protein
MNILQVTTCRPKLFWEMYESFVACPQLKGWQFAIHTQDWLFGEELELCNIPNRIYTLTGPKASLWQSRRDALPYMPIGSVLCFVDDDMLFTPETDYDTPAAFIRANRDVGVVATNLRRHPGAHTWTPHVKAYSEAPAVGVMGGMLIGYEAAQRVLEFGEDNIDYRPDDVHISCATYVAGLTNYMYHGSVCIHNYGQPGGILDVQRANPWQHAGHPDYFELNKAKKYLKGKQWKLELTQKAHDEHAKNAPRWL